MKEKIKKYLSIDNFLAFFIILCPILDMSSFLFRNYFNVNISASTFIRPIIPIAIMLIIFFRRDTKFKLKAIGISLVYLIYAVIHMYLFSKVITESSYGGLSSEIRYLINYSFMILNLFVYMYVFKEKNTKKLEFSVLIAMSIYVISIYISLITKTASHTYIEEQIGYKGWFESGNSLSIILIMSLFIISNFLKDKKYRLYAFIIVCLSGLFLTTIVGTRLALIGFIFALIAYVASEIFVNLIHKHKINKKMVISISTIVLVFGVIILAFGSNTIKRRMNLKEMDKMEENTHITGDLSLIKNKIDSSEIEDAYMNEENKKAIVNLYDFANRVNLDKTNRRMQELMYHVYLIKYQSSPVMILFGNGYMAHFYELILEMEILAFLFNFGVIGFILYYIPFLSIYLFGLYRCIKNIKKIDSYTIMILIALTLAFASSLFAGYTFFNSSSATIITLLCVMLINKVSDMKKVDKEDSIEEEKELEKVIV